MLKQLTERAILANDDYALLPDVVEKEILQHDIIAAMVEAGVFHKLTFIGGTSLRLCHNSSRLSEDLDFNADHNFKPESFDGLETFIKSYIEKKYDIDVYVGKPSSEKQGNTSSWKISIEKEPNRPDLPRQKMHIDVCAIPSFDIELKAPINHYSLVVPTEGLLLPTQSLKETLVDKFIALAYRSRRIKPRDVWDIVWMKQQNVSLDFELLGQKLESRGKEKTGFLSHLESQVNKIINNDETETDFNQEMSRFVPTKIKNRTLDNPQYWAYVQSVVQRYHEEIMTVPNQPISFDMSL